MKSCNDKNSSLDCNFTESEIANAATLKTTSGNYYFMYSAKAGLSDVIEFQVEKKYCNEIFWEYGICSFAIGVYGKITPPQ